MALLFAMLLMVVLLASWALTLLGMPGNWLIVLVTAAYAYCTPAESHGAIGWKVVAALLILAALGEIIELTAGAAGTVKAGGSRRGAVLALVGSMAGGILGVFVGMPIPVIGSLFAAVLLAGLGAMLGAIVGELWAGQNADTIWQIGRAAFWARLFGTIGKLLVGAIMVAIVMVALVL